MIELVKCSCGSKTFSDKLGGWVCGKCRLFYDRTVYLIKKEKKLSKKQWMFKKKKKRK